MKKTFCIILSVVMVSLFLFPSCTGEDYCADRSGFRSRDVLQFIRFVEFDEWGHAKHGWSIGDMENKEIELIAMTERFMGLQRDTEGNVVKQVRDRVEARRRGDWLELYMDYGGNPGISTSKVKYFVLKIDEGLWFNITASYFLSDCNRAYLKSYALDGKTYAQSTEYGDVELIPFDEKKKRDELKKNFPDGFPYKM